MTTTTIEFPENLPTFFKLILNNFNAFCNEMFTRNFHPNVSGDFQISISDHSPEEIGVVYDTLITINTRFVKKIFIATDIFYTTYRGIQKQDINVVIASFPENVKNKLYECNCNTETLWAEIEEKYSAEIPEQTYQLFWQALYFIILHEVAHQNYGEPNPDIEVACDSDATAVILCLYRNTANKDREASILAISGVFIALLYISSAMTLSQNKEIASSTHPSAYSRIDNALGKMKNIVADDYFSFIMIFLSLIYKVDLSKILETEIRFYEATKRILESIQEQ